MKDRSRCVILVPVGDKLEPECERGLAELSKRGYAVRRMTGHSAIDQARSQLASDVLADGFEELFWIDADIGFDPDSVDALRAHDKPVVSAIYPKKGQRELACHVMPGTKEIVFGEGGGLAPILYAATGFLYTQRRVYDEIRERCALPVCNARFGHTVVPYFMPMTVPDGEGHWYLGEDYAFCERARRAGFEILADTTIRLFHIGRTGYSWEEAGGDRQRFKTYKMILGS